MKRSFRLRSVLPLGVLVIFLLIISLSLVESLISSENHLKQGSRKHIQRSVASLARLAEHAIRLDPQLIEDSITQVATDQQVMGVAVIKPNGYVLFGSDFSWRGKLAKDVLPFFEDESFERASNVRKAFIHYDEKIHTYRGMMSFSFPSDKAQIRSLSKGAVYIVYDLSLPIQQARVSAIQDRLPEIIAILVLAIILAALLHRYVAKPLDAMESAAHRIAEGNFNVMITPSGPEEIQGLALAFGRMNKMLGESVSKLDAQSRQIQGILDNVFDGIITINHKGIILSFNSAAQKIFGYAPEDVLGRNVKKLMPEPYNSQHDGYLSHYIDTGEEKIISVGREVEGLRKDGDIFPMELAVTVVDFQGDQLFIGVVGDISERKEKEAEVEKAREELLLANKQLEKLVRTDGLTSIANRRYFDEVLEKEFHRALRQKYPISLLMFDVDHFKKYNDHYGHSDGDKCLIKIALATDGLFRRSGELVARYGGEEFVVIMPNTDADSAIKDAEKLVEKIMSLRINHEASPTAEFVSVSIGVSTMVPSCENTLKRLLLSADEALYRAKENGRNQVHV